MLSIRLLGPTQVRLDGRPLILKRRKSRALLFYLAAHPHPVARRQAIALLWPDHSAATARHNLRTTVYSLRQALGDALAGDDEWLHLAGEVEVDARQMAATLAAPAPDDESLTAALALYQGDFLADFDLPDAPEYDDWSTVEREHYRRLAIHGFTTLSRRAEAAGDYQAALRALGRALSIDPFQEDLQRAGLRLHFLAGDRAGAIRRYEELRRLLDDEMGVPPMAETRALYDAIITDSLPLPATPAAGTTASLTAPASAPSVSMPPASLPAAAQPANTPLLPWPRPELAAASLTPFTGRAAELAQLHAWREAGQLILVEGEAGIGKTRLVETFLEQCLMAAPPDAAPLVLVGRARELESRLPYQPIIEALRSLIASPVWPAIRPVLQLPALWRRETARLVPELGEGDAAGTPAGRAPDESRLWEGVVQLLAALAQLRPLLLFVDDLQWADAASLGLLGYLVRQTAALPVTALATSRPAAPRSEPAILLQSLLREERLARLALDRLNADDVLALAHQLSPGYGYPLGSWLYRGSEGSPYILAELVRYARDHSILTPGRAVNLSLLPATPVVPPSVYSLIQARLLPLSEAARRVLDAAVAVGREFEFEVVARAAALSDSAALDALDELRQARLVHPRDGLHFVFDHSLILEVAQQEVGELRHRLLHRRVAAALESIHHDRLDEVAGLLARHYAEGDQPAQAARYAWLAGQRAVRLAAWRAAAEFFRQALPGTPPAQQAALLAALGNAQVQGGELAEATDTLRRALELPETAEDATIRHTLVQHLSEAWLLQGRYTQMMELAQRYVTDPEPAVRLAAEFMWGAALGQEGLDLPAASDHLRTVERYLQSHRTVNGALQAQVEFELGNLDAQQGRLEAAIERYQAARRLSQDSESDAGLRFHILALNNLAYHLHLLGDPAADDYAQRALALAQDKGMLTLLPYLFSTLGELALARDDLATAEGYFMQGLAHAQRLAYPERIAGLTANLGLAARRRGQVELAVQRLSTALAQADAIPNRFLAAQIRLWLAPLMPAAAARAHLAAARSIITGSRYHRLEDELARLEAEIG